MSEEDQKHIFKLFGKLQKTYHINQQGVGLGLMISKKLVECLGGTISVRSTPGNGSVFTFTVALGNIRQREVAALPNIPLLNFGFKKLQDMFSLNNWKQLNNDLRSNIEAPKQRRKQAIKDKKANQSNELLMLCESNRFTTSRNELEDNSGISEESKNDPLHCNNCKSILVIDDNSFNILAI